MCAAVFHDSGARNPPVPPCGRVDSVSGLLIEIAGPLGLLHVGGRVDVETGDLAAVTCEIVGFHDDRAVAMPFGHLLGVRRGSRAVLRERAAALCPTDRWLGRVIDAFGQPLDGGDRLPKGARPSLLHSTAPAGHSRPSGDPSINLVFRTSDVLIAPRRGQRIGLSAREEAERFCALGQIARKSSADVVVAALVGCSGREAIGFIEGDLGSATMGHSVVVMATADESPLMQREAACAAIAVAEHFRSEGRQVLFLLDSVTRLAEAQRDIGLAAGEPPGQDGFSPGMFGILPRLLARIEPGDGAGSIAAVLTAEEEAGEAQGPAARALSGLLDGWITLKS